MKRDLSFFEVSCCGIVWLNSIVSPYMLAFDH